MAEASQLFAETSVYARKKLTGYSCASMLHLFVRKMKALAFWPPFSAYSDTKCKAKHFALDMPLKSKGCAVPHYFFFYAWSF